MKKIQKKAYFNITIYGPSEYYTIIYNAWQLFQDNDSINVVFYDKNHGSYDICRCETEKKYFYKYLMNILINF